MVRKRIQIYHHARIYRGLDYFPLLGGGRFRFGYDIVRGVEIDDCFEVLDQGELETWREFETRVRARVDELSEESQSAIDMDYD